MFVNNFLAAVQVRLSPNLISHTLDHRKRGDYIWKVKGHGRWEVCALLSPSCKPLSHPSWWIIIGTFVHAMLLIFSFCMVEIVYTGMTIVKYVSTDAAI